MKYDIIRLSDKPDLKESAAVWFHKKWGIPLQAYMDSISESLDGKSPVPSWYIAVADGEIIAGLGVIENDFHDRPDLSPNICAVYTEAYARKNGIAGALLNFVCENMHKKGIDTLYLVTDHTSFYERYGWEFFCDVHSDGEEGTSRMYIHRYRGRISKSSTKYDRE